MNHILRPQKQYVEVGDRILMRSQRQEMALFVDKPGVVVVVFSTPRRSCLVRMEDQHGQPDQFVYRSEVTAEVTF